jgi:hypothetical protein
VRDGVTPARRDEQLIAMLVDRARSEGLQLTGEGGLLRQLTKRVLESALEGEITDHLGCGHLGRRRWRGREVLAERLHGPEEQGR